MFDSSKAQLSKLLDRIDKAEIQLPDFQRGWVWSDSDIRSLLASVTSGFPIGSLLTLRVGGEVAFKPRLIEGVEATDSTPDELLLDGQQRMTTLYQALFSQKPVKTINDRGGPVERYYYLDIARAGASSAVTEDAIIPVPPNRIVKSNFARDEVLNLSTPELEYEQNMFPLNKAFDAIDWTYAWRDYSKIRLRDIDEIERQLGRFLLPAIQKYEVPFIRLEKDTNRTAVCVIFEKVNTGGKKLDAFELLTAIYAADTFDLRADWLGKAGSKEAGRQPKLRRAGTAEGVLKDIQSTDFLQACTLLHSIASRQAAQAAGKTGRDLPAITCRHEDLLDLPLSSYKAYADRVERGFLDASRLLNDLKVLSHRDVPYPPQTVALAAVYAWLENAARNSPAKNKIEQWFWCAAVCEYYSSTTESRMAGDVPDLVSWIQSGEVKPKAIANLTFQVDRLLSLRSRGSAAYKAIHALLMKQGCKDFITGHTYELMSYYDDQIDIHHIFPQKWCLDNGYEPATFNSIINKTPLSAATNKEIGGRAPSSYLKRIEDKYKCKPDDMDAILRSHLIEPDLLRADDFNAFFADRKSKLAAIVGAAMKQPPVEGPLDEPVEMMSADDEEQLALLIDNEGD